MDKLLPYIEAIKGLSKDIHYELKGTSFYGNHLLMDRIHDSLNDFQDEIKENYFMYNEKPVPTHRVVMAQAISLLPEDGADVLVKMGTLNELIKTAVYQIEQVIKDTANLDAGDSDLLGRLSSALKNDSALLGRVLMQ